MTSPTDFLRIAEQHRGVVQEEQRDTGISGM
jgi:hypothetical protein